MENKTDEPPERGNHPESSLVLVGKNRRGQWVVQHQTGLFGGLFVDSTKAMRFALDENGHRPQSVVVVSDVLEFDMGCRRPALPRVAANSSVLARVA